MQFFSVYYRYVFHVPFIELSLALNIWLQPMQVSSFCWVALPWEEAIIWYPWFDTVYVKNIFFQIFVTPNNHPFRNLKLGFILKIFLKVCKFQLWYSYKIYSYSTKRVYVDKFLTPGVKRKPLPSLDEHIFEKYAKQMSNQWEKRRRSPYERLHFPWNFRF